MSFISHSEAGQDAWVYRQITRDHGSFLDIGANDPIWHSNSKALEEIGWRGVLVDRDPKMVELCQRERESPTMCVNAERFDWRHLRLPSKMIDYLSLDIDADAAMPTLHHLIESGFQFRTATIEHDRYSIGDGLRNAIRDLMLTQSYSLCVPDVRCPGGEYEDWWTLWPLGRSMIGRWQGTVEAGERYGFSDDSYIKAAQFLDDGEVQDWGAGTGYARRFFHHGYVAVDGSGEFADIVTDLRQYHARTPGILMRHVLEHNYDWRAVLLNALASCDKLALVVFTPFANHTHQMCWNEPWEVPDISFKKSDLTECFRGRKWSEETIEGEHAIYGGETIFYVDSR